MKKISYATQKGITLFALIITIIVMLILVAVSITIALNTGIFNASQHATNAMNVQMIKETAISNGSIDVGNGKLSIDDYVGTLNGTAVKVGDIIEYSPDSEYYESSPYSVDLAGCGGDFYTEDLGEWKVLSVDGGTINIIPAKATTQTLMLGGANGWNNGIKALDNICAAVYGNKTGTKYSATARSLTLEDINKVTGYTPTPSTTTYGPATSNNKYPIEYLKAQGVKNPIEDVSGCGYSSNSEITVTQNRYSYMIERQSALNEKMKGWLVLNQTYWLASQCIYIEDEAAHFVIPFVLSSGTLGTDDIFHSKLSSEDLEYSVRPVVSLTIKVPVVLDKEDEETGIKYWKFSEE